MKMRLFALLILISANCFAESSGLQYPQFIEEFPGPDFDGCRCDYYIPAVGGGHGFKPVFFSPCDKAFVLMKLKDRFNFFKRSDPTLDIEKEGEWRNQFYKITLNLRKNGTGEESVSYEGELTVNKGSQKQTIKVVGECGL